MPELPEVETVCRAIAPHVVDRRITDITLRTPSLRNPLPAGELQEYCLNRRITGVCRRAKYIVAELENGTAMVLHLGMTGSFRVCPPDQPYEKHDHVIWTLSDGFQWRFHDPRRFGSLKVIHTDPADADPFFSGIGPEPLSAQFSADYLKAKFRNRTRPVKNALLDQRVVAGIGNIYACEALHSAKIAPTCPCGKLKKQQLEALVECVKDVLNRAIDQGGTTIRDYRTVDGSEGKFAQELNVYGKEGDKCPRCGDAGTVSRLVQAGRSTFFCPRCQG